jgi:predicted deacylase
MEALLFEMGMTAAAPARSEPQAIFYDSQWVRADSGGILISHVALGDRVVAGQPLGIVVDPINNIEREISSPVIGRVIGMARNQVVLPGFAAFHLGEEKTADAAAQDAASDNPDGAIEEEYDDPPPPERPGEEEMSN